MKKLLLLILLVSLSCAVSAQSDDPKVLHQTARSFMTQGDWNNAIVVLNRILELDKNNLDYQKDLIQCFYYKRDFEKAVDGIKKLINHDDADVVCFQLAGNVYKAIEDPKECEKVYKQGLKKFPKSGPLYSEYGELLWEKKDYSAIDLWEKGIENDPAYGGNYYNAALYYFYTKEKVWGLIYGEIFVNMESMSQRGAALKDLLLKGYKEKLFATTDLMKGEEKNKNEFSKAFLEIMNKQTNLAAKGVNTSTLIIIRTRFILDWYHNYAAKYPFRLFDFLQQMLREGMFEAYNQWLFGTVENLPVYDEWTKTHPKEFKDFDTFQKSRVFKIPPGQYYHDK
jgi:tetratricopeptide (TPR) repeat protein